MNSSQEASVAVDDGWHTVVAKKRPTRTNTTTSVKSTKDATKKKAAAPSRSNTNVSTRSVHVTIPNSVVEALAESNKAPSILSSCVDETRLLDPVRVIDALHAPRPASHKSWKEMDPKERKKEKKTRMIAQAALAHRKANAHGKHRGYGQGNSFGASPAPAASWRDDKSGADGGAEGEGEVMTIEGGLTGADFEGDEGDFSDYSDYSDDDGDAALDEELADLAPHAPEDNDGDADLDALALATAAASKGAPRSILRTGTSGNLANVAFSADPIDRQAAAPARSSTAPSGKYLPPHRKVSIVAAMPNAPQPESAVAPAPAADPEPEVGAEAADSVCTSADQDAAPAVTATVSVTGSAAVSATASQKPERTATNTSTHRKGTPAVFLKNTKDRNMNDDWRTMRANAGASISRTNTNTSTSVTAAAPAKADKEKPKPKGKAISRSNTNTSTASDKPTKPATKPVEKTPVKQTPAAAAAVPVAPTPDAVVAAATPEPTPVLAKPQPKQAAQPQLTQRKKDKTKAHADRTTSKKTHAAAPMVSTDQLIRGLLGLFVIIVTLRLLGLL